MKNKTVVYGDLVDNTQVSELEEKKPEKKKSFVINPFANLGDLIQVQPDTNVPDADDSKN